MNRALIPAAAVATFLGVYALTPPQAGSAAPEPEAASPAVSAVPERSAAASDVYYEGCNSVRAAGAAPLYRGQPGYREGMDGDDDGIACEPHRGRSSW